MVSRKKRTAFDLNWARWVKKYPGRYIAVMDGKVLAVGRSRWLAFKKVEKKLPPRKEIGLFYIPSPDQYPMLLHVLSLSRN